MQLFFKISYHFETLHEVEGDWNNMHKCFNSSQHFEMWRWDWASQWKSQPFALWVLMNILVFSRTWREDTCRTHNSNHRCGGFPVGWCSVVWVNWKLIAWKNSWRKRIANERFKIQTAPSGATTQWKSEKGNDQQQCPFSLLYLFLFSDILRSFCEY